MINTTLRHETPRGCHGSDTLKCRRVRTIQEFLKDKNSKPVKANNLPYGVVRLSDLIEEFINTHNQQKKREIMKNTTSRNVSSGQRGQRNKDNTFSSQQQTLFGLLRSGEKLSAKHLMRLTSDRDPRSTIRYLRKRGILIGDVWVSDGGPRYKLYFLVTDEPHRGSRQLNIFSNEA